MVPVIGRIYGVLQRRPEMANVLNQNLAVIGKNLDDCEEVGSTLLLELFPDTALSESIIQAFERVFDVKPVGDYTARRSNIIAAHRARGGLSKDYFESLGNKMGDRAVEPFTVTLTSGTGNIPFVIADHAPNTSPQGPATLLPGAVTDPPWDTSVYTITVLIFGSAGPEYELERKFNARCPAWCNFIYTYDANNPLVFGQNIVGADGGSKDTFININSANIASGTDQTSQVIVSQHAYGDNIQNKALMQFDLTALGSSMASSAILTLFKCASSPWSPVDSTAFIARMTTDWGIDSTNAGISEDPATQGQATWGRAKDFGGVGDVYWDTTFFGVDMLTTADYTGYYDLVNILNSDPKGTQYDFDITDMVNDWQGGADNYGLIIGIYNTTIDGQGFSFYSSDATIAAYRPYLTVLK